MNKIITFLLLFSASFAFAQSSWKKIDSENYSAKTQLEFRKSTPNQFDLYSLNTSDIINEFENNTFVYLPINGTFSKFSVKESSPFTNTLHSDYGYIKTFSIKGIDDKTATGKVTFGTDGMHIIIFSGKHSTIYIDPYTKDKTTYITYKKSDLNAESNNFSCLLDDNETNKELVSEKKTSAKNATDGKLRTYRLALACTVEYANFHLSNQGVSSIETDAVKNAAILSAMNTTISRVNGIFERDLGVTMNIVVNNNGINELIFINSDELTNDDAFELIDESQEICDSIVGSENYDIGHTFSTGAGGLATLGAICNNQAKAKGVTGSSYPIGDSFDIDFVAHELGHQFGANHTFNNSCDENRWASTAVEPGSGSTIMAYAGICSPNIQNNSYDYFHSVSIDQMWDVIDRTTCATETDTNNLPPTVNAGEDYFVPVGTPLVLKGEATDEDSDNLTYCWEQTDADIATMPPLATSTAGPSFQSFPPSESPDRYLPSYSTVLNGSTESEWEVIPTVAREMNFSLVVRDNHSTGGASERDDMKITFVDSTPFSITSQNERDLTLEVGSVENITWEVGNTNQAPINCENVRIKLSLNGGETFPITLAESTPNDGSFDFTIPNQATTSARILIESIDNIFYTVSASNFSIIYSGPTFVLSNISENEAICKNLTSSITYTINSEYINGFTEEVSFSVGELPEGLTADLETTSISETSNINITLNNINTLENGNYVINVYGESSSISGFIELPLFSVYSDDFEEITLTVPTNNSITDSEKIDLSWTHTEDNTFAFDLEIASDNSFNNIIISEENLNGNTYTINQLLDWSTTYFWRVKPKNNCGEGTYSNTYSFTTEAEAYCSSNFFDATEYISYVGIGSIDNHSGNDSDNDIADGYEDFTNISTTLITGYTYILTVEANPLGFQDHCYVFIDWDNDSRFNTTNERYDLGNFTTDPFIESLSTEITVPNDAVLEETRMRVIIEYYDSLNSHGTGSCSSDHNSGYGETEDYTLNITNEILGTDDVFDNFAFGPNPSTNFINLMFDIPNPEKQTIILISDFTGKVVKSITYEGASFVNTSIPTNSLRPGFYFMNIQNGNKETTKRLIIR